MNEEQLIRYELLKIDCDPTTLRLYDTLEQAVQRVLPFPQFYLWQFADEASLIFQIFLPSLVKFVNPAAKSFKISCGQLLEALSTEELNQLVQWQDTGHKHLHPFIWHDGDFRATSSPLVYVKKKCFQFVP